MKSNLTSLCVGNHEQPTSIPVASAPTSHLDYVPITAVAALLIEHGTQEEATRGGKGPLPASQSGSLQSKSPEEGSTGSDDEDDDDDEEEDEDEDEDETRKHAVLGDYSRRSEAMTVKVSTTKGVKDRLQARTPEYNNLVDKMRHYVCNNNLNLNWDRYEELESSWILFTMPAAILRNSRHILHVRNKHDGTLYVVCYTARLFRVKRMHGRLKKILQPLGYKMHKLISHSPEIEDFYNYVPSWVDTKAYRESFASQFGVFVKRPDQGPDFYLKLANSMKVFKTSDRAITGFIPFQPIHDEKPKRAFDIVLRYFDLASFTQQSGAKCPEPQCAFASTNKEDLIDHINTEHVKYPGFRCATCSQSFLSKRLLLTHAQTHAEVLKKALKPKSSKELLMDDPIPVDPDTAPLNLVPPRMPYFSPRLPSSMTSPSTSTSSVSPTTTTTAPPGFVPMFTPGNTVPVLTLPKVPFFEQPQPQGNFAFPSLPTFPLPFPSSAPYFLSASDPSTPLFSPLTPTGASSSPATAAASPLPTQVPPTLNFVSYFPQPPSASLGSLPAPRDLFLGPQPFLLHKKGPNLVSEAPSPPEGRGETLKKRPSGSGLPDPVGEQSSLKRHKEVHLGTPWAAETVEAQYELMRSYFDVVPMPPTGLKCPDSACSFVSTSRYALATHANESHIHHDNFVCPHCPTKFPSFEQLTKHRKDVHPSVPHETSTWGIINVTSESDRKPFLTVKHKTGETDLYLTGGMVVARQRLAAEGN